MVLASLLAVSRGMELSGVFSRLAISIVGLSRSSARKMAYIVILMNALTAPIIMNDSAMLIFTPLAMKLSELAGMDEQDRARLVALTAISANIGSALTPIGNPQNIVVWRTLDVDSTAFVVGMTPHFLAWLTICIAIATVFYGGRPIRTLPTVKLKTKKTLFITSSLLLILNIALVEADRPVMATLITFSLLLALGREALLSLDLPLIAIFLLMFVDFNELSETFLSSHIKALFTANPGTIALASAVISQAISNVPAAILLSSASPKTSWLPITIGVNIGGTGLITGSLANLIAVRISKIKLKNFHKTSIPFFALGLLASIILLA